jgi:hypothetical protein
VPSGAIFSGDVIITMADTTEGVEEAPIDGNQYARKDGT